MNSSACSMTISLLARLAPTRIAEWARGRHRPRPRKAVKILFGAARDVGIVDQHIKLAEMPRGGGDVQVSRRDALGLAVFAEGKRRAT
jgi:hypothetical protein